MLAEIAPNQAAESKTHLQMRIEVEIARYRPMGAVLLTKAAIPRKARPQLLSVKRCRPSAGERDEVRSEFAGKSAGLRLERMRNPTNPAQTATDRIGGCGAKVTAADAQVTPNRSRHSGVESNIRILPPISGRFNRSRRLRPDSAKGTRIRHAELRAEIRMSFRCLSQRHLSVV
jgi:hypothetical protein